MVKIAVCDDEPLLLEEIAGMTQGWLRTSGHQFQIECFKDGSSLLESREKFDVVFLDIQMKSPDGMETAEILRNQGWNGILIFITVLKENVFDAFGLDAFDYILKPVEEKRFHNTMVRIAKILFPENGKKLIVSSRNGFGSIPFAEIIYCEVRTRKLYLHLRGGAVSEYYGKLEQLEKELDGRFFRCHRSCIVNLDEVRSCASGTAVLSDGSRIPVSRTKGREFTKAMLEHMQEW